MPPFRRGIDADKIIYIYRRMAGIDDKRISTLKAASLLSVGLLVVLLAGSLVFYRERMLFIDAPHNLFRIINDGHLAIEEHRYGSFISQIWVLLAARCHVPPAGLMAIYSASFNAFFLVVGALLAFGFRNHRLVVLLALYYVLFASATFYWPNNEVHQGIAWLLLAFGIWEYMQQRQAGVWVRILVFALSFALAMSTHPLVVPVAIFLWVLLLLERRESRDKTTWWACSAILLLLAVLKLSYGMRHGYDSTKMEAVTSFHLHDIKGIISSPQLHFFVHGCWYNYWLLVVLFIAGSVALVKKRSWAQLIWTCTATIGYVMLVCIAFRDNANRFYIESEYMPLTVIGCAPFVLYVLPYMKKQQAIVLLLLIFCVRLGYIAAAAQPFVRRVSITERVLAHMRQRQLHKAVITGVPASVADSLIMTWGAPVESLMLSQQDGDNPQYTFIIASSGEAASYTQRGADTLIGCWELRAPAQVNSHYFHPDTSRKYTAIEWGDLMK